MKGSDEMTTKTGRLVGLVLALALIICSSEAQAQRYGVNRTISVTRYFQKCTTNGAGQCTYACTFNDLPAKCQNDAPTFCNPGDTFISATYGGDYPPANCNYTQGALCYSYDWYEFTGSVDCRGSCNALCEINVTCECFSSWDCELKYGPPPEGGTWDCNCFCLPNLSPLVLHLPDYFSTGGGNQNWWKKGFCGPEAPTVCLDWSGDGNVTCTAWLEPGSEIAFGVALSDNDMLHLLEGAPVRAEPSRHFFGNVTMGPQGDHPFENGFAALAAYCGQDPVANSEIDLTECGASLYVWDDRNGDGKIDIEELLDFQDLGITSLGDVRKTGKRDRCGNTFRFESNATCSHGTCGKLLDVFFQPR